MVFAILGMQLFSGEMASCINDPQHMTKDACVSAGEVWENPPIGSFDDFGTAMRLLYIMSTGDSW